MASSLTELTREIAERVCEKFMKLVSEKKYEILRNEIFNNDLKKVLSLDVVEKFYEGLHTDSGAITKKVEFLMVIPPRSCMFLAHFEKVRWNIKLTIDDEMKLDGVFFLPYNPDIPKVREKETTESTVCLPFETDELWFISTGGDTGATNFHHDVKNQKYAIDFCILENEKAHRNFGNTNEDFYCFGKKILSPVNGKVTDVIRGVEDNIIGLKHSLAKTGNSVIIQHLEAEHEFSVLSHLMYKSVKVKVGDIVEKGRTEIGRCGNSGNSSGPHLHFHVMNTRLYDLATGIKCPFESVRVRGTEDGNEVQKANYKPVTGEYVRNGV